MIVKREILVKQTSRSLTLGKGNTCVLFTIIKNIIVDMKWFDPSLTDGNYFHHQLIMTPISKDCSNTFFDHANGTN